MDIEALELARTADENERATLIEEQFTEAALEAARAKAQPESQPDFDGQHCVECAQQIPRARLALGRMRCVACQQRLEREARLYPKRTLQSD